MRLTQKKSIFIFHASHFDLLSVGLGLNKAHYRILRPKRFRYRPFTKRSAGESQWPHLISLGHVQNTIHIRIYTYQMENNRLGNFPAILHPSRRSIGNETEERFQWATQGRRRLHQTPDSLWRAGEKEWKNIIFFLQFLIFDF